MIVSDSTALITLININEFALFGYFSSKIVIPHEVYAEVAIEEKAKIFLDAEIKNSFVQVLAYKDDIFFKEVSFILDRGESAAIVLAKEHNVPLLIDEKKGRKFAENIGVKIIGLVGLIKFLYLSKKLSKEAVLELIGKLEESDFRVSKKILDIILDNSDLMK